MFNSGIKWLKAGNVNIIVKGFANRELFINMNNLIWIWNLIENLSLFYENINFNISNNMATPSDSIQGQRMT